MPDAAGGHQELRDAIRALCADFPAAYHRKIDEARGYPAEFVDALTKAGWLAALIPEDYGQPPAALDRHARAPDDRDTAAVNLRAAGISKSTV